MTDLRARLNEALANRYRIERELGAGGMATVYLAHDVRHDRDVAIKILRPELAAAIGAGRFLAEIRTTAGLQHPHILPLFDSGEVEATVFYVMPLVGGESLRDRLTRQKQLPIDDAIRITQEVAGALDYAHRHGVVHRDIKPENILLHEGQALVADFGIALAASGPNASRMTETGISLGTPVYMSPEQAMGERQIDARTDIYALACVLFEMLAGEPPHTGPTLQSVVAKVMKDDARPLTELRKTVPAHVAAAVSRALEKLPADRFASARDFADALARPDVQARTAAVSARQWPSRPALIAAVLGGIAVLGASFIAGRRSAAPGEPRPLPTRLALLAPEIGGSGVGQVHRQLTLSADGSSILYMAGGGQRSRAGFYVQALDAEGATPIPGTDLMYAPLLSPDGRWLAVRNGPGDLMRIPATGSATPPAPLARGWAYFAWHPDGTLYVTRPPFRSLEKLAPDGSALEPASLTFDQGTFIEQIVDEGRSAIVVLGGAGASAGPCALLDLKTGRRTPLVETPIASARYAAGHLVYVQQDGTLLAAPLDLRAPSAVSTPVTLATGVSITGNGDAQFDVAPNGTLAYIPEAPRSLVFVSRDGSERPATGELHNYHMPRFSPDGSRLLTDFVAAGARDVWMLDLRQKTMTRTSFDRDGHDASWAPDGTTLVYSSLKSGDLGIYRVRPGASDAPEAIFAATGLNFTGEWLPDASALVTVAVDLRPKTGQDIGILRNGGKGPLEPLVATPFAETYPTISRDGAWLAFVSDQSGKTEVYVRRMTGTGDMTQVSQGGGDEPVWSRDGREIFYRSYADSTVRLIAARIDTTSGFRILERQSLFDLPSYVSTTPHAGYDVSPDSSYFAFVRRNAASRIVIVQHFPELVRRQEKVPAR